MNQVKEDIETKEIVKGGNPEPKTLSRQQQRKVEQIEKEAMQTYAQLSEKFFNFFLNSDDPEGPEVEAKKIQLCSQWKMYCFRKRLTKEAFPMLDNEAKAILEAYRKTKEVKIDLTDIKHEQKGEPEISIRPAKKIRSTNCITCLLKYELHHRLERNKSQSLFME